jgi:hypothetical protein
VDGANLSEALAHEHWLLIAILFQH